ncbi:MAG: hypothetical protein ACR2OV_07180, partial [Hyphomicrobiaceae bacterium]
MLSPSEVERYHANGQLTPGFRLDDAAMQSIINKMEGLFAAHPELDPDYAPGLIELDQSWLEIAALPEILDA